MINFARQLGAAFGVNSLSLILDLRTIFHGNSLAITQAADNSATAQLLTQMQALLAQAGVAPDIQSAGAIHYLGKVVLAQAWTLAFRDSFLFCAFVFTLALAPAWYMGMRRAQRGQVVPIAATGASGKT
jgi:hypothetical protein